MVPNLEKLATEIEQERGALDLLGLFKRKGHHGWELAFSAPWATNEIRNSIDFVSRKAAEILDPAQAGKIVAVLALRPDDAIESYSFLGIGDYGPLSPNDSSIEYASIVRLRDGSASAVGRR